MSQQQQFDPRAQTWHSGQPQMPPEEFYSQLEKVEGLVGFFEMHPHFIPFLMMQLERMISGVLDRKLAILHQSTRFQANLWTQQFPTNNEAKELETAARDAAAAGVVTMIPGETPGSKRPQTVTEELDLQSNHFISQLTDSEIAAVEQFHNRQHNTAQQIGYVDYNHPDPNQATAYTTAWGTSYQQPGGQWDYRSNTSDIYSAPNNGYPAAPPNGMANPYRPPPPNQGSSDLKGALVTSALGYFMKDKGGPDQSQYQAPPPRQPYYY